MESSDKPCGVVIGIGCIGLGFLLMKIFCGFAFLAAILIMLGIFTIIIVCAVETEED